jgi:hypothetical protein
MNITKNHHNFFSFSFFFFLGGGIEKDTFWLQVHVASKHVTLLLLSQNKLQ